MVRFWVVPTSSHIVTACWNIYHKNIIETIKHFRKHHKTIIKTNKQWIHFSEQRYKGAGKKLNIQLFINSCCTRILLHYFISDVYLYIYISISILYVLSFPVFMWFSYTFQILNLKHLYTETSLRSVVQTKQALNWGRQNITQLFTLRIWSMWWHVIMWMQIMDLPPHLKSFLIPSEREGRL